MTWTRAAAELLATRRAFYDALKAAGQTDAPRALPPPTAMNTPLDPASVLRQESVAGGWSTQFRLRRGEAMRLATQDGTAAAAVIAWNAADPSERLNYADTVKLQWTTALRKGRVLFSDMGRVLLSITEDTSGAHDALLGGTDAATTGGRNTRDNFVLSAAKLGLGPRDIPPCISFFAPVSVGANGRFAWHGDRRRAGDFVDLRAEMDLLVVASNCRHPLDPDRGEAGPLDITLFRALVAPVDLCRTATAEARRGFENTDPLFTA